MPQDKSTVRDLRRSNRSVVLRALFFGGPCSRIELQQATSLSSAGVSNVVGDLVRDGLVVEAGMEESDGGRPAALLTTNPAFGHFVGVEAGETRIKVELFDFAMTKVAGHEVALAPRHHEPQVVADHIVAGYRQVLADAGVAESAVVGMGVGVPGVVEQTPEHSVDAPAFGWRSVPLGAMLSPRIGPRVRIDNGAKVLGQAEMWFGAGRGIENAVVIMLGTGIGAAIFGDGVMYRGAAASAGEWGHVNVVLDGRRCRCGASGCLEAYVGGWAIAERWARASRITEQAAGDEEAQLERLVGRQANSRTAQRVLSDTARYLGVAVAGLVNLLNPQRIVIGGWAGLLLGEHLLPTLRRTIDTQALPYPAGKVTVALSQLGPDATALGSASLIVEDILSRGGQSAAPKQRPRAVGGWPR
jgi:predicted NBD/HSP70 family sugar kinase